MTNREEFGTDYQERMERAQSSWWVSSMHELGRQLLKAIPPDARVIDIGCGTGATLRWLAPNARESVGVDVSIEGLAVARETAPGSRLAVASAAGLPFADKTMDIVVSTDVLQHLRTEDRQAALREMHRVLVPGGRILVRTNAKSLRKGVAERADWQLIRGSVLRREAEDAGLVCERMTHANAAGAVASALVVAEVLRLLHGGSSYATFKLGLAAPGGRTRQTGGIYGPQDLGGLKYCVARALPG